MKVKFKFIDQELYVCQYRFFGLLHDKDEDRSINLPEVEYVEKVPLTGLFGTKYGVEFVTKYGESLYAPNLTSEAADSLISQALSNGATQKEHTFRCALTFL